MFKPKIIITHNPKGINSFYESFLQYCNKKSNIDKLFLDDERVPVDCAKYMHYRTDCRIYHEEWNIVRSYKQFVSHIETYGLPKLISFDHDLADLPELKVELDITEWFDLKNNKEYTGMDCAKWLVDYCIDNNLKLPEFIVHSANPAGTENIKSLLENFKKSQQC